MRPNPWPRSRKVGGPSDWTGAGAVEVSPGVHRIPLPMPNEGLRAVNVYALTDPAAPDTGCVLIDSGWAIEESRVALENALAEIGQDLGTVGGSWSRTRIATTTPSGSR